MLPTRRTVLALVSRIVVLASMVALAAPAHALEKQRVVPMSDYFHQGTSLSSSPRRSASAVEETAAGTTVFYSDMEGSTAGWGVVDYRAGQPVAWHLVTGEHACVGTSWWMGANGLPRGDGYDNNWVQSLMTNVPIDLSGTTGNMLRFKTKFQSEYAYDFGWILIKGADAGARWDTLASYSGNYGTLCINQTVNIPDRFTTIPQPVTLQFLFGSDLSVAASDSLGAYTGWTLDEVEVRSVGSPPGGPVRFFDDMENGRAKWVAAAPDPGPLWHVVNSPSTSQPATCSFLRTNVWVPFQGSGSGVVPDYADAMLTTPTMDLASTSFTTSPPGSLLELRFDDWENIPFDNLVFWSLWIRGSNDGATWTEWRNTYGGMFVGAGGQCAEQRRYGFDPYNMHPDTGIQPGTRYIQLGFRIRDEMATGLIWNLGAGPLRLGTNTEGIYFDNIGVYDLNVHVPTVSVSPGRGFAGTIFSQPGAGFTPNADVELHFRKPDGLEDAPPYPVEHTDASGNYSHTYNSSAASQYGTYYYWAIDLATGRQSNTTSFQVDPPPTVSVSPTSGPVGTVFSQPGTGFTPNAAVELHFRKPDGLEDVPLREWTSALGNYSHTYNSLTAPQNGTYYYWAIDLATGRQSNTTSFRIDPPPFDPTVSVSPTSGPRGTDFYGPGTGFTPNADVELHLRKPDGQESAPPYPVVRTVASGAWAVPILRTSDYDRHSGVLG